MEGVGDFFILAEGRGGGTQREGKGVTARVSGSERYERARTKRADLVRVCV